MAAEAKRINKSTSTTTGTRVDRDLENFFVSSRHFNRGVMTASTPQFSDIHDYMAYHHCTVTSHKSSSVHTLVNSINYAGRRSHRCMRQKYVFSHIHLPAGLTHSLILHSSLFSKYMMHELHLHKDTHTHTPTVPNIRKHIPDPELQPL